MNEKIEFDYERTDEQLIAYSSLPILDRLRWLDEVRQFTLMVREAPTVDPENSQRDAPRWRSQDGDAVP
jgi:hypothetical protein